MRSQETLPGGPPSPSREAGYTMVIFVMVIAILAIMMGVAVQTAEFQMRREREAELIFRGQQYVEAIRLYRLRFGRYPMRLKEIWEADPKVTRRKWKDPITDSYDWGLIHLGQGGRPVPGGGGRPGLPGATATPGFGGDRQSYESNIGTPQPGGRRRGGSAGRQGEIIGPIIGVHSKSCDESIKVYEGRSTYCEWRFVLEEARGRGAARAGGRPRRTGTPRPFGFRRTPRGVGDQTPPPEPTGTPFP